MERLNDWLLVFAQNKWVAFAGVAIFLYVIIKRWQDNRLERAKRGYPILKEDIEAEVEEIEHVRLD